MDKKIKNLAIIVAAGHGKRFNSPIPKQYSLYKNKILLRYCLDIFVKSKNIDAILNVIHPGHENYYYQAVEGIEEKLLPPVYGGDERQDSVYLGLKAIDEQGYNPEFVYIHDAARIFLTTDMIQKIADTLLHHKACIPALDSVDSLKKVDENHFIVHSVNRDLYKRAQTPQAFAWPDIFNAHKAQKGKNLTDDAAIFEAEGYPVKVIEGDIQNIKVTYVEDILENTKGEIMDNYEYRSGIGYDVHAFTQGDSLWLGGIKIPFHKTLKGHSDADVALHAITDALFGAMADGDIGSHFPPSDMKWKGAASDQFLIYAVNRLKERGGQLVNIDLTIIGERPKITPLREDMKAKIAEIMNVEVGRVSVKATTTEKLGFTGREEGLAAQALVNIKLPIIAH